MLGVLLDLVLPRPCVGCGQTGLALCAGCGAVTPIVRDVGTLPVLAAGAYEDGLRRAVLHFKERGRRDLARPLGRLLAPLLDRDVTLVPVPSSSRDRDHVPRLVRAAGRRPIAAVRLARAVADSAGLDVTARAANLAGAHIARPPRTPSPAAVIVDDIVTSGATLAETARALTAAGWRVRGAVVLAATPYRKARTGGVTIT